MSESPSKRGPFGGTIPAIVNSTVRDLSFVLQIWLQIQPSSSGRIFGCRWRSSRAKKTNLVFQTVEGTLDEGNGSPCVADGIVMLVGGEAV
jgi:hypothetical protein